jgi:hypothetical protein
MTGPTMAGADAGNREHDGSDRASTAVPDHPDMRARQPAHARPDSHPERSLFVSRGWAGFLRGLPRGRVWPSSCPASRSFVLASLRALHLDPGLRRRRGSAAIEEWPGMPPGCRAMPGTGPAAAVVAWRPGPGVACPKSRCRGCEPAAPAAEPFPRCPPGSPARAAARRASACRHAKIALLTCRFSDRRASSGVLPPASFLS